MLITHVHIIWYLGIGFVIGMIAVLSDRGASMDTRILVLLGFTVLWAGVLAMAIAFSIPYGAIKGGDWLLDKVGL